MELLVWPSSSRLNAVNACKARKEECIHPSREGMRCGITREARDDDGEIERIAMLEMGP
jgi:hypothetical protein